MSRTALLLERLATLIHQSVREEAALHGLLPIHLQVLAYLARANRYSDLPIAVAEYFGITRGTVSQTVTLLERRGLIAKTPDEHHGRRIHLTLTAAGEAVLSGGWSRRLDEALRASGDDDAVLESMLRTLLATLQRHNGSRPFGLCRQCAHFRSEAHDHRCGLTGEALSSEQTGKICRDWTARRAA
jgi:DNA-binding MarR family transcriptional regulator